MLAVFATVCTLACVIACRLATAHIGWWYAASLAASLGVGLALLPKERGYFRLTAALCLLQAAAFAVATVFCPVIGAWFYAGVACSVYQLIWASAQAMEVRHNASHRR